MASLSEILRYELECALSKRFPAIQPQSFELIGSGVTHAFGMTRPPYRVPEAFRASAPSSDIELLEGQIQEMIEEALLTGDTPDGSPPPTIGLTAQNMDFMRHLDDLPSILAQLPKGKWHDALVAMTLIDIRDAITPLLRRHGIDEGDFMALGKDELSTLVADLPTRAIDLHMHWQVAKNPNLNPKPTDLEDWGALIPAAAYCDVLVCEKQFADLLGRDRFSIHAKVLTDVRDIPQILA